MLRIEIDETKVKTLTAILNANKEFYTSAIEDAKDEIIRHRHQANTVEFSRAVENLDYYREMNTKIEGLLTIIEDAREV